MAVPRISFKTKPECSRWQQILTAEAVACAVDYRVPAAAPGGAMR
jgi:hypothetical protein